MYSTDVYVYIPRQEVVLNVGNSPRRYNTVYAKNLKLHKGVDNRLQFKFLNQEQKPVDISGVNITCRLISDDGATLLKEKTLVLDSTLSYPATGIAELRLTSGELEDIRSQFCYYTLEIPSDSFNVPVFVDSQAGGRGKIHIVDSILPDFQQSIELSMRPRNGTDTYYYSDVYYTKEVAFHTFQITLTDFTGTVDIEGLDDTDVAYTLDTLTYDAFTGSDTTNVTTLLPKIRFKFNTTEDAGITTDKVLVR